MYWKLKLYQLTWGALPSEYPPQGKQCCLPKALAKILGPQDVTSTQIWAIRLTFSFSPEITGQ